MATINDNVNATGVQESEFQSNINPPEVDKIEQKTGFDIIGILKSPTGEGSVSDYIEHPLNFLRSEGLAQILRGLTGMIGNLKLAIIDIVVGSMNFAKERRKPIDSN